MSGRVEARKVVCCGPVLSGLEWQARRKGALSRSMRDYQSLNKCSLTLGEVQGFRGNKTAPFLKELTCHTNQIISAVISVMDILKGEIGKDPGMERTFELKSKQEGAFLKCKFSWGSIPGRRNR